MGIHEYARIITVVALVVSVVLYALDTRDRRRQRTRTVDAYLDHLATPPQTAYTPPVDPTEPIPTITTSSTLTGRHRPNPGS